MSPRTVSLRGGGLARHLLSLAAIVALLSLGACEGSGGPADTGTDSVDNDTPFGSGSGPGNGTGSDDPDAPFTGPENYDWASVPEPQMADDVVNLDDVPCFDSLEVSEDFSSTIVHLLCPASSVDIGSGDLLVSSVGEGYLLRVLSAENVGYDILAETTPGTLTELFPDGGFFATVALEDESRGPLLWGATDLYKDDNFRLRFEGAAINLNTPELVFGTHHSGGSVVRRDLYFQMESSISVSASARATQAISHSATHNLYTQSFNIRVVTGTFIYVGQVELSAKLKVSASVQAAATVKAGATLNTTLRVGTTYNETTDRFEDLENIQSTFTPDEISIDGKTGITLKASIDFRAEIKHYRVVSTYLEMGPYLKFSGTPECKDLNWTLKAGWGGKFGAHADVYFWNVNIVNVPFDVPFGGPIAEGSYPLPFSVGGDDCPPEADPDPDPDPEPGPDPDPDPEPTDDPEDPPPNEGIGACTPVTELTCGQTITGDTSSDPLATSVLDAYTINIGNYSAPELVYRWNGSGPVRFRFVRPRPTRVNHDIMIIEATGENESCSDGESLHFGFNSVLWDGSGSVFVVIDGYNTDSGAFELEVDCSP